MWGDKTEIGRPSRTRRLVDQSAKPALPGSGATLPDAANGLSRVQHGYGTTVVSSLTLHQSQMVSAFGAPRIRMTARGHSSLVEKSGWSFE